MSWMEDHVETDIQTAIQSQAIQTALERQTTATTDAGFQSFLQSAPIPRLYLNYITGQATVSGTILDVTWGQGARIIDPYQMHQAANTTDITIPIDGFYCFNVGLTFNSAATAAVWQHSIWFEIVSSKSRAAAYIPAKYQTDGQVYAGALAWNYNLTMINAFNQGDKFKVRVLQNSGAATTLGEAGGLNGFWSAPYNQYTAGSGGN